MEPTRKNLHSAILKLLAGKREISIHDIAKATGLFIEDTGQRRTIQRALKDLIEKKAIRTQGAARARTYALIADPGQPVKAKDEPKSELHFQEIPLSESARELLSHLVKPIQARDPAGYNQDFLRGYQPNRSFYLSAEQRATLHALGRAESAERPAGTYARNILNRLLIDLSWNSSRLEGNTYSLLETKRLIELGENAAGKDAAETQMILNHKGAIEFIIEEASEQAITAHTVCSVHALLSENLLGDPAASGRLRLVSVGVTGTTYIPLDNPHVLKECFEAFVEKMNQIEDPFEQSFFALIQLSYLQAFEDVNKRTARLVANIPMVKRNLKPLSFTDVPKDAFTTALIGVYERNDVSLLRDLFIWAYERSAKRYSAIQQSMGEPNLLKLKYRDAIQDIVQGIVLEKVEGQHLGHKINSMIELLKLPEADSKQLFQVIETEIMSLHDGNIARFKIRPNQFVEWKKVQGVVPGNV